MSATYIPSARSSVATGRIKKAIDEIGGFPWAHISEIVDETVREAIDSEKKRIMEQLNDLFTLPK